MKNTIDYKKVNGQKGTVYNQSIKITEKQRDHFVDMWYLVEQKQTPTKKAYTYDGLELFQGGAVGTTRTVRDFFTKRLPQMKNNKRLLDRNTIFIIGD